jgi:transcriptional regulator with XRE-family HTH domain
MSTIILRETHRQLVFSDIKINNMDRKSRESLPEFVRRIRREKDLSTLDVERLSGNQITDGYVSLIENGHIRNVSPEKLHALARGLGISDDEIFAVVRGKPLEYEDPLDEVKVLFNGWEDASDEDKIATMEAIRMIAESFQRRRRRNPTKPQNTNHKGKKKGAS